MRTSLTETITKQMQFNQIVPRSPRNHYKTKAWRTTCTTLLRFNLVLSARIQAAKLLTLSPNKPYGLRVYALGRKLLCVRAIGCSRSAPPCSRSAPPCSRSDYLGLGFRARSGRKGSRNRLQRKVSYTFRLSGFALRLLVYHLLASTRREEPQTRREEP